MPGANRVREDPKGPRRSVFVTSSWEPQPQPQPASRQPPEPWRPSRQPPEPHQPPEPRQPRSRSRASLGRSRSRLDRLFFRLRAGDDREVATRHCRNAARQRDGGDVNDVADLERRDVDRELDRDVARLRVNFERAEHDADLTAVDRALRLADELERNVRANFLVRIDREQVDVRDLATQRVELVLLDERVQLARCAAAVDRQVDHGVLLADRVERGAERLDVDDDRQRIDAAIGRGAVTNSGNLALRAQLDGSALTSVLTKRDSELSDLDFRHDRFPSIHTNKLEIESP